MSVHLSCRMLGVKALRENLCIPYIRVEEDIWVKESLKVGIIAKGDQVFFTITQQSGKMYLNMYKADESGNLLLNRNTCEVTRKQ